MWRKAETGASNFGTGNAYGGDFGVNEVGVGYAGELSGGKGASNSLHEGGVGGSCGVCDGGANWGAGRSTVSKNTGEM